MHGSTGQPKKRGGGGSPRFALPSINFRAQRCSSCRKHSRIDPCRRQAQPNFECRGVQISHLAGARVATARHCTVLCACARARARPPPNAQDAKPDAAPLSAGGNEALARSFCAVVAPPAENLAMPDTVTAFVHTQGVFEESDQLSYGRKTPDTSDAVTPITVLCPRSRGSDAYNLLFSGREVRRRLPALYFQPPNCPSSHARRLTVNLRHAVTSMRTLCDFWGKK